LLPELQFLRAATPLRHNRRVFSRIKQLMPHTFGGRVAALALVALVAVAGAGCSSVGYYAQAAHGHLSLMSAARPIDDWLADPATPEPLKRKLTAARQMRAFAATELGLPDNRSYTAYADLQRSAVVWNVFATPELSVKLKTWCYLVFGCAGYRGYFDQAAANQTADALRAEGYDVNVGAVPAYSTLGWTNWLGGDPLLNTFIHWSDAELARLIFHELAHQVVYVKDDTVFNESFATAVERVGVRRWLAVHGDDAQRAAFAQGQQRRADFLALLLAHRAQLVEAFADDASADIKRERKRAVFASLQAAYRRAARRALGRLCRLRPLLRAGPEQRPPRRGGRVQRSRARFRGAAGARGRRPAALLCRGARSRRRGQAATRPATGRADVCASGRRGGRSPDRRAALTTRLRCAQGNVVAVTVRSSRKNGPVVSAPQIGPPVGRRRSSDSVPTLALSVSVAPQSSVNGSKRRTNAVLTPASCQATIG
jgi:predicted aminopeptidase